MNFLKLGCFALGVGLSAVASAQERNVNVAYRAADVRTVLRQLGQVTNSPVVIDRGVEGRVTFSTNGPMTADEFRSAVLSVLAELGYQITERDGALLVGPTKL